VRGVTTPMRYRYDPRQPNPLYHFLFGLRFFFGGVGMLLRHPSLMGLAVIPILLTIFAVFGLAFLLAFLADSFLAESLGTQARLLVQTLSFLLALFLGYLIYLPLARIFLAPVSEVLSRRAWAFAGSPSVEHINVGVLRAMWEGAKLVALQLVVLAFAFVLGVVFPPVGVPLGIFLTLCVSGIDFLDVPLSLRGLPLRHKLGVLWQHKAVALGFSAACYLLLLIPLVNLVVLPVGVVGATLLVSRLNWQD
jgi:CysZ protein